MAQPIDLCPLFRLYIVSSLAPFIHSTLKFNYNHAATLFQLQLQFLKMTAN